MAKVTITFSDQPGGTMKADVNFAGGFQKGSMAHQHAQILLKMMDNLAQRIDEPKDETPRLVAPPENLLIAQG